MIKYLEPREAMLLLAMEKYLLTEIPGPENNPEIVRMFKEIGHSWVQDDETAWCSAFINWLALTCKVEMSGELTARSWLKVGIPVEDPMKGDLVVFWRKEKEGRWGHVGLYVGEDEKYIHCLGGNQSNQVNISKYAKSRLLSYRSLKYIK